MGFPEHVRLTAARFYEEEQFNAARAGARLAAHVRDKVPSDPGQFCRRWYLRNREHNHAKDKRRAGRPRKIPDSLASELAEKIVGTPSETRPPTYHPNLRCFYHRHPCLGRQVAELKVSNRTVERAIRRADPRITKRKPGRKKLLNAMQKKARKQVATTMKREPFYRLRSIVFVDEATLEMKRGGSPTVYARKGEKLPPEQHAQVVNEASWRVHYLAGVTHGVGSVGMFKLTGTTGHPKTYMVSNALTSS
jgi:hypothetical protein